MDTPLVWIDYVISGLMVITGPYGFYASIQRKRIQEIEIAPAGVPPGRGRGRTVRHDPGPGHQGRLPGPLREADPGDTQRMAAQIDWGVPASEAMRLFAERVDTPLVKRMTSIIIKANDAGGIVADVLTMVAHDARETMLNQAERKIAMSTYMMVIYIAFAVFIATIFILNTTFLPKMMEAGQSVAEGAEKAGVDTASLATIKVNIIPVIQVLFIVSVVIHAFGDGILAGVLSDGQISTGMKHSFIMLLIGIIGTRLI